MKMNNWLRGILVIAVLTGVSQMVYSQEANATSTSTSVSLRSENGTQRWKTSIGLSDFNIEVRGKIEITDNDKDIRSISNDGYLQITKTVFGSKRSITIESLGGGNIRKEYLEGRTKMDWEPNGKNWLGEILPEIVRSTTLGAEGRVNRIFAQGGTAGVLSELSKLSGDYTRAHYAGLLLEKDFPPAEMPNVISRISDIIHSDYYLASVYQNNIKKMLGSPDAADAFYRGTQKINSDYYRAVVLKEALKKFPASPTQVKAILHSASTINSDYYLSVVLTSLLEENDVKEESLNELIIVSKKIPSDYYRTQVLKKALDKQGISQTALKNIVDALADVSSDYYKTSVFNAMSDQPNMDPDVQLQVIHLIGSSVGSDYYAATSLKNLLEHQKLTDASFKDLVAAAGHLGSANYASDVLRAAASENLSKNQLMDILKASGNIGSDHYLSQVLMALADQVKASDQAIKDAYRQTAKKIGSDTYYGRAIKAID